MANNQAADNSLQQRVNEYLRNQNPMNNAFFMATQTAEADLNEYLLKRAEAELSEAQAKVDALKKELAAQKP